MSLVEKLFGNHSEREIKHIMPLVDKVLSYDEQFSAFTDEQLKEKNNET